MNFKLYFTCLILPILLNFNLAASENSNSYNLYSFVNAALNSDPRFPEQNLAVTKAKLLKSEIQNKAIIPKLEISGVIGPAPEYYIKQNSDGESVGDYDFGKIEPFFGTEIKVLQPLSFFKLKNALNATDCNIKISECDLKKYKTELCQNYQELYFKYLFANQMLLFATTVKKQLEKVSSIINDSLDAESSKVSQDDLFNLKTYFFKIDDGLFQAQYGTEAAKLAISFSLNGQPFSFYDSIIYLRPDHIPSLDSLMIILSQNHPDLQKLTLGIKAQENMVKVAKDDLYPDAYIVGSFKFSRVIDKNSTTYDTKEDLLNPFNKKEGGLGLGIHYNVNFWSSNDNYRKEKVTLESLKYKNSYALKGLQLGLENQYRKVQAYLEREKSAEISLNASESLLKSAYMKYDLDPSVTDNLLKAYEKNIQARKDYYQSILDYDLAVSELITKTGLTLDEYHKIFN